MGLDVFAAPAPGKKLSWGDRRAFAKARVELAGGMYSGDDGSFRGKLYTYLVQHLTGESLYQGWIPPETVARMSKSLDHAIRRRRFEPTMAPTLANARWRTS